MAVGGVQRVQQLALVLPVLYIRVVSTALCVCGRARASTRVCVFFNNIQHAPLQSNITCFRVKQLQYGYI